jgi:hypothetical protein
MRARVVEQRRPRRRNFPLGIVLSLVFLILGVAVAYALLVGNRVPEPNRETFRIIRPDPIGSEQASGGNVGELPSDTPSSTDAPIIGPITPDGPANIDPPVVDQFSEPAKRAAAYRVNSAALKRTVDQYAKTRANHCAGEVTVQTDDTPLNVRSGPSTGNPVLMKAAKGSKQSVLLWAPDTRNQSARWFLLVDDGTKTVKGWVTGEYCDASSVVFAN